MSAPKPLVWEKTGAHTPVRPSRKAVVWSAVRCFGVRSMGFARKTQQRRCIRGPPRASSRRCGPMGLRQNMQNAGPYVRRRNHPVGADRSSGRTHRCAPTRIRWFGHECFRRAQGHGCRPGRCEPGIQKPEPNPQNFARKPVPDGLLECRAYRP